MNKTLEKIVIIGNGTIAKRHYKNLILLKCNPEIIPFRKIKNLGLEFIKDYSSVIICTPSESRIDIILKCYDYNIPFYCEKPLVTKLSEIKLISDFKPSYLDRCFVGFMMRYHPLIKHIKSLNFDNIYSFYFKIGYNINNWRSNWTFKNSYSSNPESGGVLFDLCHEIDLSELIFGDLNILECYSLEHRDFIGVDFFTKIILNQSNFLGEINMDYINDINIRILEVHTKNYNYYIDFNNSFIETKSSFKNSRIEVEYDRNEMFINSMNDFIKIQRKQLPINKNAPILSKNLTISKKIIEYRNRRDVKGSIPFPEII